MIVKLLTQHHLEFLNLKGGCRGSSESTHVKMSNCWKSHAQAQIGTSKGTICAPLRAIAVVLMLLIRYWLLLPLWDSVIILCIVMRCFMSILVLQSSWWGRESWLFCLVVFLVYRDCCVALLRGAMGLSAVPIVVFPYHTHWLFFIVIMILA